MGTNAFKQIVRTIQNKIPVSKGLIRRSRETEQGYLADIHNFELEDGTLKFRQGTRLMANMVDELWYDIQSFKFGNTELVMGINYKRELWGWLAKWPETSFKIWNTSPFRRAYPHVIKNGVAVTNGHFSFKRGNKFYMLEDNFSVILVNDYAEIFRIMKNGCFRITADYDYADQREAIQDARDDDSLSEGRIYLDIKEATNKVFDERMYIGEEYIRRSHRITGETRFAWVNELGVVSELSDPVNIEGYKHAIISKYPTVTYDKENNLIPISRVCEINDVAKSGHKIYQYSSTGITVCADAGNAWHPVNPYATGHTGYGLIISVQNGIYHDNTAGTDTVIPEGVYMSLMKTPDVPGTAGLPFYMAGVEQHNYNIIQLDMFDGVKSYSDLEGTILPNGPAKIIHRLFAPVAFNALALPRLLKTTFPDNATTNGNIIPSSLAGSDAVFDVSSIGWVKPVNSTGWIKLSSTPLKTDKVHTIKIESGLDYYKYAGEIFEACIRVTSNNPYTDNEVSWGDNVIRGVELDAGIIVANWSMWKNIGYDCWDYLGQISGVNINNFDFERNGIAVTGVDSDTDVILATDQTTLSEILSATQRFALWNNSHIMGISQRAFCDTNGIVYKGSQQLELSNFNYYSDPVSGEKLTLNICYLPLMTLDFTGLRRIPMPLPMIRRAMRNPQHLTTAGGKVYSVEDNKIWVGSVDDFMMTDFIEIHSAVDHIASMDTGIVVSTRQGLFYVASGEGIKRVIGGEMIMSKFLAPCSGGVLSVDGRDIHIIYKQVTDSGAWYPSVAKINNALTEINLEGEIKSVSIGDMIYIADDWNVWIYDMANKVWAGKKHYKNRIHRLFGYKNKLGVAFETGVNRRNSFPLEGGEKS